MTIRQGNNIISGRVAQCGFEIGDIGMSIFVDESKGTRRYLNGSVVSINKRSQGFLNRLKQVQTLHPSIICTEQEWQSIKTMSAFGQCGKFVIDETAGTIRLPRIVMPIQGLTDLTKLGEIVEQGLPNIKGGTDGFWATSSGSSTLTGALVGTTTSTSFAGYAGQANNITGIDASRSSSIYKDGANVQQEQVQYPYFIQIATGQETSFNIENEIEFNNPYSLGDSKYSPNTLANISWLASNGQWNDGSVYKSFFDYYILKIGESFGNGNVKNATDSYTDYDLVIDSANWQFRLPLLDGSEDKPNFGNAVQLPLTVSTAHNYTVPSNGYIVADFTAFNSNKSLHSYLIINNKTMFNGSNSAVSNYMNSKTGMFTVNKGDYVEYMANYGNVQTPYSQEQILFIPSVGNGTLYYYVGETVQNANLIDAGRIAEQLANKADITTPSIQAPYIKATYKNGTSGYRIWSDGYCEQWGAITVNDATGTTVTYLKQFKDTNYSWVQGQMTRSYSTAHYVNGWGLTAYTETYFTVWNATNGTNKLSWKASGYLAEGEY